MKIFINFHRNDSGDLVTFTGFSTGIGVIELFCTLVETLYDRKFPEDRVFQYDSDYWIGDKLELYCSNYSYQLKDLTVDQVLCKLDGFFDEVIFNEEDLSIFYNDDRKRILKILEEKD